MSVLRRFHRSLEHQQFLSALANRRRLLVIQDLDGVCMGLVRDPRERVMDMAYIEAVRRMQGRFFVLTNGEHIGSRGVNGIVDTAVAASGSAAASGSGWYLPGLAAGGVQLQDSCGRVSHPGVSERELAFLASVPAWLLARLGPRLVAPPFNLSAEAVEQLLQVIVLDNLVSPTLNIGALLNHFRGDLMLSQGAQQMALGLLSELMQQAEQQQLGESFFIHLAPNLGSSGGVERLKLASATDMGTTDFQFMLRGAIKEAGVLVLLNHYYFAGTGEFPLGEDFSARRAPIDIDSMVALAKAQFDPQLMPTLVGVGDTVTSVAAEPGNYTRGGSDRGFLTLVQRLGGVLDSDTAVVFVDSSGGELDRPGVNPRPIDSGSPVPIGALQGITDSADPLEINVIFPDGYPQYTDFFVRLANQR
ncbi:glucosylglycerol 3-phosphatase [Pseudomaricurvus sp. HS19]|uniref:glucosylglycerol 3-phosphatase n=1 Tax=Pseudomaricurvus sp. HS19 TaxID=2692626 RepID=UPI00136D3B0F|nr:glucosylglycerol 3-phosphatase [Pseudomaricurvus sp. HS19]MYM63330.1 glucosylglycerol 3-phosphatase [Pseudomaricurvus sp. HS19]